MSVQEAIPATPEAVTPSVFEIFRGFLLLGLMGFGGVLPLARRMIVEERRWLSATEFAELLGLCQFLPGGNIINLSVALGTRFAGILGALAALFGLIAAPTAIVLVLGTIYARFASDPHVVHMFAGLAAAAAGLLVAMAFQMSRAIWRRPRALVFAVACFLPIVILHWPLIPTLLVVAPISILATRKYGL
jgi:chromate transporter